MRHPLGHRRYSLLAKPTACLFPLYSAPGDPNKVPYVPTGMFRNQLSDYKNRERPNYIYSYDIQLTNQEFLDPNTSPGRRTHLYFQNMGPGKLHPMLPFFGKIGFCASFAKKLFPDLKKSEFPFAPNPLRPAHLSDRIAIETMFRSLVILSTRTLTFFGKTLSISPIH